MNNLSNNGVTKYYSEEEAATRLRELEAKYDLFKYTVDGYSVWQQLRFKVALSLQSLPLQKQGTSSRWLRLGTYLFQSIADAPAFFFPNHARYAVKTCSSALNEKEADCWKDIYFDDLLKEIGNSFKIEALNNPAFFHRRKAALVPVAITTATIDLLSAGLSKYFCPTRISHIANKMASVLQDEPDLRFLSSYVISQSLCRFYWSKNIYKWLLMRIRPEFSLYEGMSLAICSAAKELGIKTIEFQHGIFSHNHPNALPELALPYKPTLIVPEKLFLYGDYWKRELEKNRFYEAEICVVGNTRIEHYRRVREIYRATRCDDSTCHIVLTTQGFAIKQLIRFVSEFINLVEGQINYQLCIKLHPGYDRDRVIYDEAFSSNQKVQVISGAGETSTFNLLAKADLHLSIASACHYEALGIGVPTVILALPAHEVVQHLADSGHAYLAHTPKDLVRLVMKWRDMRVPPEVSDFYFQRNTLDNLKRELGI